MDRPLAVGPTSPSATVATALECGGGSTAFPFPEETDGKAVLYTALQSCREGQRKPAIVPEGGDFHRIGRITGVGLLTLFRFRLRLG